MADDLEKLNLRLKKMGGRIGGITLGDRNCTTSEIAKEINLILDDIENGNFEQFQFDDSERVARL